MKILYVCSGNVFRSMAAEYLSKKYIADYNIQNISIDSAGTTSHIKVASPEIVETLASYGCDASGHVQIRITPEFLEQQDLIICMAEHHRERLRELGFDSILFNEIAYGKTEDVLDDTEFIEQHGGAPINLEIYFKDIVHYIHDAIPFVIENILKK